MIHFVLVPVWVWLVLLLAGLGPLLFSLWRRRRDEHHQKLRRAHADVRAARYKAWRWLYGQPKQKRLVHRTRKPGPGET